jgi:class 3 adenylate cyclase
VVLALGLHPGTLARLLRLPLAELDAADFPGQRLREVVDELDRPRVRVRREAFADELSEGTRAIGLEARVGLHTGECELVDGKPGGIAVHIGARIAAEAEPGEVLVSGTVKDLVAGSDIDFRERGLATLTGIPGQRQLFAVAVARSRA